jgi:hypothetical protein
MGRATLWTLHYKTSVFLLLLCNAIKAAPVVLMPALEANSEIEKILADRSYEGNLGSRLQTVYECVLEIGQADTNLKKEVTDSVN